MTSGKKHTKNKAKLIILVTFPHILEVTYSTHPIWLEQPDFQFEAFCKDLPRRF